MFAIHFLFFRCLLITKYRYTHAHTNSGHKEIILIEVNKNNDNTIEEGCIVTLRIPSQEGWSPKEVQTTSCYESYSQNPIIKIGTLNANE